MHGVDIDVEPVSVKESQGGRRNSKKSISKDEFPVSTLPIVATFVCNILKTFISYYEKYHLRLER